MAQIRRLKETLYTAKKEAIFPCTMCNPHKVPFSDYLYTLFVHKGALGYKKVKRTLVLCSETGAAICWRGRTRITAPSCRVKRGASHHGMGNLAQHSISAIGHWTWGRLPDRSSIILWRVDLQIAVVSSHSISKSKNTLLEDRCGYRLQVTSFSAKNTSCFTIVWGWLSLLFHVYLPSFTAIRNMLDRTYAD